MFNRWDAPIDALAVIMCRPLIILIASAIVLASCNQTQTVDSKTSSSNNTDKSYFLSIKDSFPKTHLTVFKLDYKELQSIYRTFPKIHHLQIDTVLNLGTTYLYSWQNSRSSKLIEFTCLTVDEYRGFFLTYFIADTTDNVISSTRVAGLNGEDGVSFELSSRFISTDTLYQIDAISTDLDRRGSQPYKKLQKSKGDSVFYKAVFDSTGHIKVTKTFEKKELNY